MRSTSRWCSVNEINGLKPEFIRDRVQFEYMTPLFPSEKFCLTGNGHNNMSTRVVDLFSPDRQGAACADRRPAQDG